MAAEGAGKAEARSACQIDYRKRNTHPPPSAPATCVPDFASANEGVLQLGHLAILRVAQWGAES